MRNLPTFFRIFILIVVAITFLVGCTPSEESQLIGRENKIPINTVKVTPQTDVLNLTPRTIKTRSLCLIR